MSKSLLHLSNMKLNAAGLTPDDSLTLSERTAVADEVDLMQAIERFYTDSSSSIPTAIFSAQVVYSKSNGDVLVGMSSLQTKRQQQQTVQQTGHSVKLRLLTTPDALPPRTMCIDLTTSSSSSSPGQKSSEGSRTLIVLKRSPVDGLITSITEEEGHRKTTAPLAARAAAAGNFCSPTDNMLSPCTSKLNLAKKKHHLKGKPTTLFASQMASKAHSRLVDDEMEL